MDGRAYTIGLDRHDRRVNRRDLRDVLDAEGVGRNAYRLDGTNAEDALAIGPVAGGWRVWFTERGRAVNLAMFDTEDEACDYLADRLLTDDSNRWVLVAGPSDAVSADRELDDWLAGLGTARSDLKPGDLRTEDLPWTEVEQCRRHWILRTTSRKLPRTELADDLISRVRDMREFRMGVHRVAVVLADGRIVRDVLVSGKRVSWVFGCDTIPFGADDVVGVLDLE